MQGNRLSGIDLERFEVKNLPENLKSYALEEQKVCDLIFTESFCVFKNFS